MYTVRSTEYYHFLAYIQANHVDLFAHPSHYLLLLFHSTPTRFSAQERTSVIIFLFVKWAINFKSFEYCSVKTIMRT